MVRANKQRQTVTRLARLALVMAVPVTGCRGSRSSPSTEPPPVATRESAAILSARADSARHPYTKADIHFMSGMISHHAQAIRMSRWAMTHDASPSVLRLTERIIAGQTDEIALMQTWLRNRLQPVPEPDPAGMKVTMDGVEHTMLMPGMLTREQIQQLEAARGIEYDRLFLTFMTQHHRGALAMVKDLFGHAGAGKDQTVFRLASEINTDQTNEINRMLKMLLELRAPDGHRR